MCLHNRFSNFSDQHQLASQVPGSSKGWQHEDMLELLTSNTICHALSKNVPQCTWPGGYQQPCDGTNISRRERVQASWSSQSHDLAEWIPPLCNWFKVTPGWASVSSSMSQHIKPSQSQLVHETPWLAGNSPSLTAQPLHAPFPTLP